MNLSAIRAWGSGIPRLKRVSEKPWFYPAALLLIGLLAYGYQLASLGFYWDDWPFAWLAKFLGPGEFIPAFRGFRPFLGPIFLFTTSLVPASPLLWQIFALLIRFASGLAAWFALIQVWPEHRRLVLITSLLFLAFPGYSQHWVALTHINQEWIPLVLYLLSFGFTARAVRYIRAARHSSRSARYLANTLAALLLLIAGLFPTEYFMGLEPLRFFFIWIIISEGAAGFLPRLRQAIKAGEITASSEVRLRRATLRHGSDIL